MQTKEINHAEVASLTTEERNEMGRVIIVLGIVLTTATPVLSQVVLVDESLNVVDGLLGTTFLGEVRNDTDQDVVFVEVEFALKDKEGKMLAVESGYVNGSMGKTIGFVELYTDCHLSPGEIGPFRVITLVPFDEMGSYTHKVMWEEGASVNISGAVTVLPASFAVREGFLGAQYLGEVRNDTPLHLTFVEIIYTTKDATGKVIDVSSSYISGSSFMTSLGIETDTHLAPGETGTFNIITMVEADQIGSYYHKISFEPVKETSVSSATWGSVKALFR